MTLKYKLESHVPGVIVKLTPNPLNASVTLTEAAKRELALIAFTHDLVDNYFLTADFYLNPRSGKKVDGIYVPDQPNPEKAGSWSKDGVKLWYEWWYGEKDADTDFKKLSLVERLLQNDGVRGYFDALTEEHGGDCTCAPCSCSRCHAEDLLGINTLPSGKHVNYRLQQMYFNEFATEQQREEKRVRADAYAKRYPPKPWTPDEATKARWAVEDAQAQEAWAEHKRLYRLQEGAIS